MKRILLAVAGILVVGAAFLGVRALAKPAVPTAPAAKPAPAVRTQAAAVATLHRRVALTGSVEPVRFARLGSPAEGPVEGVAVREGDTVRDGQTLLRIGRSAAAVATIAAAEADLARDAENLARVAPLVAAGTVSTDHLDQAKAAHARAQAALARAREQAGDFALQAPWAGVVSRVLVADGDYVAPRAQLIEIIDPGSLVIRVAVPESDSAGLRDAQPAQVRFDAWPGRSFDTCLDRAWPELDRRTRTRTAEFALPGGLPATAVAGMFVRVELIAETAVDAVCVPASAVQGGVTGLRVFTVSEGKAHLRPVSVGISDGRQTAVTGIAAGDAVVVAGMESLRDGMPVRLPEPGKKPAKEPAAP